MVFSNGQGDIGAYTIHYRKTFSTLMVAGELTTESLRLPSLFCGGSSRGLLDADVAIAKAAAAVDVLLLIFKILKED